MRTIKILLMTTFLTACVSAPVLADYDDSGASGNDAPPAFSSYNQPSGR